MHLGKNTLCFMFFFFFCSHLTLSEKHDLEVTLHRLKFTTVFYFFKNCFSRRWYYIGGTLLGFCSMISWFLLNLPSCFLKGTHIHLNAHISLLFNFCGKRHCIFTHLTKWSVIVLIAAFFFFLPFEILNK